MKSDEKGLPLPVAHEDVIIKPRSETAKVLMDYPKENENESEGEYISGYVRKQDSDGESTDY